MSAVWTQLSTVREGGRVEIVVPDLNAGDLVEVRVEQKQSNQMSRTRPMGFLNGRIEISDDFDEPLTDFDPYT
jgi:hypothetical protein